MSSPALTGDVPILSRRTPRTWVTSAQQRLREPAFWKIQVLIALATIIHVTVDGWLPGKEFGELAVSLHNMVVLLYLIPVAYAGLVYGLEGAILTGLWSAALASINVLAWHRPDYSWLAEIAYLAVVVTMGIFMAMPVERERRQRQNAETTARRLALLNELATAAARSRDLDAMVTSVLNRLTAVMGLRAACAGLPDSQRDEPLLLVCDESCPLDRETLREKLSGSCSEPGLGALGDETVSVALPAGDVTGVLTILPGDEGPLSEEDTKLLEAVGAQLGVVIENALLHRLEREHLESYVRLVTQAQEDERARVARELHDEAAQPLVLLSRGLDDLADKTGDERGAVTSLRNLAHETLSSLRRFARDLRPAVLDDLGLVPAIEWLVSEVAQRSNLRTTFSVEGDPRRLPAATEVALFRIAQEGLRNIERHADASRARVIADFDDFGVRLRVEDDGNGFTPPSQTSAFAAAGRLGLLGMRERAELVHGTLHVVSEPGAGTVVTATIPTQSPAAQGTRASTQVGHPDRRHASST